MKSQHVLPRVATQSLHCIRTENVELEQRLTAQRQVTSALERRFGQSLGVLNGYIDQLIHLTEDPANWNQAIALVQHEVDGLRDLLSDAVVLQKLEAGKVELNLEPIDLCAVVQMMCAPFQSSRSNTPNRLVCAIQAPSAVARVDRELMEAVLTDLLARALRYSDPLSPVVLGLDCKAGEIHLYVSAQRFAPVGNRDFATEMMLCCRRIEVQSGAIACHHQPDGFQTVSMIFKSNNELG
jgi:signal transduction histidine kinase